MFTVPFLGENDFERSLSAVRRDEANFDDIPDPRFAVVEDSCGPKFQQRYVPKRSYRVTGQGHT
jgi:hypothetical protein